MAVERIINESWFDRRHYNAIAKEIREIYPSAPTDEQFIAMTYDERAGIQAGRSILTQLALNLAKRFEKDNPNFDPFIFLNACSPDIDLYPLAELYEDYRANSG